jgi:hypothetical protein
MTEMSDASGESFEQFKNSFSYGTRSDLSFKFLENLSDEDAAEFFRGLLSEIGETFDDANVGRIHEYVIDWQVRGYTPPRVGPSSTSKRATVRGRIERQRR